MQEGVKDVCQTGCRSVKGGSVRRTGFSALCLPYPTPIYLRSPVYAHISSSLKGLPTIRAFGAQVWTHVNHLGLYLRPCGAQDSPRLT